MMMSTQSNKESIKIECVAVLKRSSKLDQDEFKQSHLKTKVLKQTILENKVILESQRPDLIDYFRRNFHKDLEVLAVKDVNGLLSRAGYSELNFMKGYFDVKSNECGPFVKNYKELLKREASAVEVREVLRSTEGTFKSDPMEVKRFLKQQKWIYDTKFPSDFMYGPEYKCLEKALTDYYVEVILRSKCNFYNFSQLIPVEDLVRVGQSSTILQNVHFDCAPKVNAALKLRSTLEHRLDPVQLKDRATGLHYFLNYSSCNGLWRAIQKVNLNPSSSDGIEKYYDNSVVTFRNEGGKVTSLERLEVFRRHQLVFIGAEDPIREFLKVLEARFVEFFQGLNLSVEFVRTNSWFSQKVSTKDTYTIDFELKTGSKQLQLGNLSYNGSHWTDCFKVKVRNKRAYSGCSGVGIQRLVYAFLIANGVNFTSWPERILRKYEENLAYMKQ